MELGRYHGDVLKLSSEYMILIDLYNLYAYDGDKSDAIASARGLRRS